MPTVAASLISAKALFALDVAASDRCLHWMMPLRSQPPTYTVLHLPHYLVARERIVLARVVAETRVIWSGLLGYNFCDVPHIPEDMHIHTRVATVYFITTRGAGAVGAGALRTWLLGL